MKNFDQSYIFKIPNPKQLRPSFDGAMWCSWRLLRDDVLEIPYALEGRARIVRGCLTRGFVRTYGNHTYACAETWWW